MSAENGTTEGEKGDHQVSNKTNRRRTADPHRTTMQRHSATPDPTAPALTPRHVKPTHHLRRPSRPVPLHQRGAHHVGVGYEEVTRRRTPDINTEANRVGVGSPPTICNGRRAQYPHINEEPTTLVWGYEEVARRRTPDINTETNRVGVGWLWGGDGTAHLPTVSDDGRRAQYPHIDKEPTMQVLGVGRSN
ncbi:hypothetical protein GALMADRAFT_239732 [Galerina marginata CBS 339.88]|uniref:Uncharacterized protein n=1 Tax=Galerina marginata (strain CBS 339.88) TaxID=685588 RepID=A0A067TRP5_GALM3|nr:hypothetical protein GALMADRAFT_239732 [Galerina marginata CBS 339.88]